MSIPCALSSAHQPGLDSKTMKELADATLDAIQLPGTSNTEVTDTSDLIDATFAVYDVPKVCREEAREKSLSTVLYLGICAIARDFARTSHLKSFSAPTNPCRA
jgi:hypothetical protein